MSTPTEIYSPGLEGVIAGETAVSTVEGGLRYRGYPVTELAEACQFDEVARARHDYATLSARLVEVEEESRRSLSRELHDEIGQTLTAVRTRMFDIGGPGIDERAIDRVPRAAFPRAEVHLHETRIDMRIG